MSQTDNNQTIWSPTAEQIKQSHIFQLQKKLKLKSYEELYAWSIQNRAKFLSQILELLQIRIHTQPKSLLSFDNKTGKTEWLIGARLNIAESCLQHDSERIAIIERREDGTQRCLKYGELKSLSAQVANALAAYNLKAGDAIAVDLPMNMESVAIYLGIILAGMSVVSIADSFAPAEIATRLRIAGAKAMFTQDFLLRSEKKLPLYDKVIQAEAPQCIVLSAQPHEPAPTLRAGDFSWTDFLAKGNREFHASLGNPEDCINILFSSGTTGDPKAIPWTHTTPLRCGADAYFHHDINPGDVLCWPTNLGWMMGPWLVFAALLNRATIALFDGAPTGTAFGKFVAEAKVTMLGLVPSLVSSWRNTRCMENLDWSAIRCFSSTGECSNADDMAYLMRLGGIKPILEYCGGTEIGGAYLTSTLVQPNAPSLFSTPALGTALEIRDENLNLSDLGAVYLKPPSIGLSDSLMNADHFKVYFEDTPLSADGSRLRRHGDQVERIVEGPFKGYFRALGRVDDTMNLGGIKVSSAEIERVLQGHPSLTECAAIAINPKGGGPSLLVIFAVSRSSTSLEKNTLLEQLQKLIRQQLNPLFKISDLRWIDKLPRTASNKVMRRVLRKSYEDSV